MKNKQIIYSAIAIFLAFSFYAVYNFMYGKHILSGGNLIIAALWGVVAVAYTIKNRKK